MRGYELWRIPEDSMRQSSSSTQVALIGPGNLHWGGATRANGAPYAEHWERASEVLGT